MVLFTWDNMLQFFRWARNPDRVDPPYCDAGTDSVMIDGEVRRRDVEEWLAQHGGSADIVWATEKPAKPGWYWWRDSVDSRAKPVLVEQLDDARLAVVNGQWAGPMEPPR